MQLIVHNPIGWSKWISRSLTLHIGSCRESLFGDSVVVSIQMWFVLPVVAVVMAADSGIVGKISRSSGDCIIELLIRIHRYSTDSDKLTMLIWSSKIRLGEFSWKWKSKQRHCTTRPACVSENKLPSLLIHRITLHHHHHATVEQRKQGSSIFNRETVIFTWPLDWGPAGLFANQISSHGALLGSWKLEQFALWRGEGRRLRVDSKTRKTCGK